MDYCWTACVYVVCRLWCDWEEHGVSSNTIRLLGNASNQGTIPGRREEDGRGTKAIATDKTLRFIPAGVGIFISYLPCKKPYSYISAEYRCDFCRTEECVVCSILGVMYTRKKNVVLIPFKQKNNFGSIRFWISRGHKRSRAALWCGWMWFHSGILPAAKASNLRCTLEAASLYPDNRVCAHTDDSQTLMFYVFFLFILMY